jgi:hypothetical protein
MQKITYWRLNHMAILKVSSARNVNAGNKTLTFGKGTNGGLTVTGTIYDASGITKKVRSGNRFTTVDLSDDHYLVECSVTVSNSAKEELEKQVANFFNNQEREGLFRLHVGLELQCDSVSDIVPGKHPITGEPTLKVLATCSKLLSVEIAPDLTLQDEEEFVNKAEEARTNAAERKATGLTNFLLTKAQKLAGKVLLDNTAQEILDASATTKKAANSRVKVPK